MSLASFLKSRLVPAQLDEQINRIRKPPGNRQTKCFQILA